MNVFEEREVIIPSAEVEKQELLVPIKLAIVTLIILITIIIFN